MDAQMKSTLALSLVGIGAVATGMLGIVLPPGERIAAGLALVVGAGIGVVVLAIGTQLVNDTPDDYASVFLVAAALGLAGTLVSLGLLWRRTADQRVTGQPDQRGDGERPDAARPSAPSEG